MESQVAPMIGPKDNSVGFSLPRAAGFKNML